MSSDYNFEDTDYVGEYIDGEEIEFRGTCATDDNILSGDAFLGPIAKEVARFRNQYNIGMVRVIVTSDTEEWYEADDMYDETYNIYKKEASMWFLRDNVLIIRNVALIAKHLKVNPAIKNASVKLINDEVKFFLEGVTQFTMSATHDDAVGRYLKFSLNKNGDTLVSMVPFDINMY